MYVCSHPCICDAEPKSKAIWLFISIYSVWVESQPPSPKHPTQSSHPAPSDITASLGSLSGLFSLASPAPPSATLAPSGPLVILFSLPRPYQPRALSIYIFLLHLSTIPSKSLSFKTEFLTWKTVNTAEVLLNAPQPWHNYIIAYTLHW